MKQALIILGRYPKHGSVKTRLAKEIGEERATKFYRLSLEKIISEVDKLRSKATVFFLHADLGDYELLQKWLGKKFFILPPKSDIIENNIQQAFKFIFEQGFEKVISIGSDIPDLNSEIIIDAFEALDQSDLVFGPDKDKAIYLYGEKSHHSEIFKLEKDSNLSVLEQCLKKADKIGLTYTLAPKLIDIDKLEDLMLFLKLKGNQNFKNSLKNILNLG